VVGRCQDILLTSFCWAKDNVGGREEDDSEECDAEIRGERPRLVIGYAGHIEGVSDAVLRQAPYRAILDSLL